MTERTIRTLAKKLASEFYTESAGGTFGNPERSRRFRETYPTLEHYLKGYQVRIDGKIKQDQPGWKYFITLARARMVQVLQTSASDTVKQGIYDALIEEHIKSTAPAAQELLQRRLAGGPTFGQ